MDSRNLRLFAGLAATLLLTLATPSVAPAETEIGTMEPGVLTACLPRNSGVIAGKRNAGGSGFDYHLMEEIASRMGLSFSPVWFEGELEEQSDPLRDTYAMLSLPLCDVVPGHPRYVRAVGTPGYDRARLPRWVGMPQEIDQSTSFLKDVQTEFVDVRPLAVSQGYMRSTIGLVYLDGTPEPKDLSDLQDRPLAFQQGTLSGAIAMAALPPQDRQQARHFNPGASFLWQAEIEGMQLAIVDVAAFDNYRQSNAITRLKLAEWRHPFGMDIGIAVLEERKELLKSLNDILDDMADEAWLQSLASSEGLTYSPPADTELAQEITMRDLLTSP
ncbi:MAG: hypothetical protein ACU0FH_03755 [Heliomarina sp.]|uniref:hypothetical protein n=1 Tax=Heliomarina sp. TaxID=2917556 RepID=UPI004059C614